MEDNLVRHRPRHFNYTICRRIEIERDIAHAPFDQPHITATCPDCECVMMYRGIGRRRDGQQVHFFECVHSHREVHSVSIIVTD
jgi:hypothetical protein